MRSAAADGSSAQPTTLAGGLSNSQNVTADATYAYFWSSSGVLTRVPLGGATGSARQVELASGMTGSPGLSTDTAALYWAEDSGFLKKLDKAAGTTAILTSGLSHPQGIAQDGTSVYWLEADTFGAAWNGTGAIRKITKP